MNNKKKVKRSLVVLVAILVTSVVGFGFGFFYWNSDEYKGQNEALEVKGELTVENLANDKKVVPGDSLCGAVKLNINSSAVSLLRVKLLVTSDGESIKKGYIVEGLSDKWLVGNDGYYYYKEGVTSSNKEIAFISGIKFGMEDSDSDSITNMNDFQGKKINVDIQAEMVQSKYNAFEAAWGIKEGEVYNLLNGISTQEN